MKLLAAMLLPVAAFCQFRELATTDDGAQLYFTSRLRQKGSGQYLHDKIFRYNVDRFELFAEEEYKGPDYEFGRLSNFYLFHTPVVGEDGTTVSFIAERNCRGGSGCFAYDLYQTHIRHAGGVNEQLVGGRLRMSRNGRYLLQIFTIGPSAQTWLIDQQSGNRTRIDGSVGSGLQVIASTGVVVGSDLENTVTLYSAAGNRRIPVTFRTAFGSLLINDLGDWVVSDDQKVLRTLDVRTGREYLIGVTDRESFGPRIARTSSVRSTF